MDMSNFYTPNWNGTVTLTNSNSTGCGLCANPSFRDPMFDLTNDKRLAGWIDYFKTHYPEEWQNDATTKDLFAQIYGEDALCQLQLGVKPTNLNPIMQPDSDWRTTLASTANTLESTTAQYGKPSSEDTVKMIDYVNNPQAYDYKPPVNYLYNIYTTDPNTGAQTLAYDSTTARSAYNLASADSTITGAATTTAAATPVSKGKAKSTLWPASSPDSGSNKTNGTLSKTLEVHHKTSRHRVTHYKFDELA
jgi:hypothetical protein